MATLTQIRQGIGTNVSNNITSISVYNYTPDRSEPPLLIVGVLDNLEYDTTMQRGADTYVIPCRLLIANVDAQLAQETLDGFIASSGANSVKQAIESDVTLSGVVSSVRVTEARDYGSYTMNNTDLIGVDFMVEVVG